MAVFLAASVRAEPDPSRDLARHLRESARLLGDPAGVRGRLERLGVITQLYYNQVLSWKPASGGANQDAVSGHSASYDFFTFVDLEELMAWQGADLLLHVKGQYDENLNADVGALSDPIDDADLDEAIYVDELWLQQAFLDDRLRFRLGFLEQQTLFDRNAYANNEDRQFLTTFLDNNAVVPLPNGLATALIGVPVPWLEVAAGAADADNEPTHAGFDTAFDGIDSITGYLELRFRSPLAGRSLPGSYRVGMFRDGRDLVDFRTGRDERGHLGAYVGFDQLAIREGPESLQGLGIFGRGGYADPDVNRIAWFWSLGFQYVGLVPRRDTDVLGLGTYQAIGSSVYRDEVDRGFDRETGVEFYYRVQALPWLAITPGLQYILDPGATGQANDAFVGSLRFRVAF
jgi:porin